MAIGYTAFQWDVPDGGRLTGNKDANGNYQYVYTSAGDIRNTGNGHASGAVNAAQQGVDSVLSGGTQVRSDIGSMRSQAQIVNSQANAVNKTAGQVKQAAYDLDPYADQLDSYARQLYSEGSTLYDNGQLFMGDANDLLSMNSDGRGVIGKYVDSINQLDPSLRVSQAASDVQAAQQNQIGQMDRDLARRGVSGSSGAALAARANMATAYAAALAGAKTNARSTAVKEQMSALGSAMDYAVKLAGTGNSTMQTGITAQNAGVGAEKDAASVKAQKASALSDAGKLESTAGELFGTAGKLYGEAANAQNNYLKTVSSAYGQLSDANSRSASYYANLFSTMSNKGGGGSSVVTTNQDAYNAKKELEDMEFHTTYDKNSSY